MDSNFIDWVIFVVVSLVAVPVAVLVTVSAVAKVFDFIKLLITVLFSWLIDLFFEFLDLIKNHKRE